MTRKDLTRRVNAYLYKSGNSRSKGAQYRLMRGGVWLE